MIPEVGLITRSEAIINLAKRIARILDLNLHVRDDEDVHAAAVDLRSKGVNCIIARGFIADTINDVEGIKVVKCDPTPQDIMESLIHVPIKASEVVIVLHKSQASSKLFTSDVIRHIQNISGRKAFMLSYESPEELRIIVERQIKKGQEWFMGSNRVVDVVKHYGKNAVELAVGEETMLNILNEAIKTFNQLKHYYFYDGKDTEINGIVARSIKMKNILSTCKTVSKVDATILMLGESGVGKGVLSHFIHHQGSRSDGPFMKINCSAIPPSIIESELFGYEGGTFTGAKREGKAGLIENARGGTLFLDEIAELPTTLQVKFLQVLQDKQFTRVGGSTIIKANIRIIAATNRNINKMVQEGSFREDLFYRLNVIPIEIPPLRERKEDIIILTDFLLNKYNELYNVNKFLSKEVLDYFCQYSWPGNIRELSNIIERMVVTTYSKKISVDDLPPYVRDSKPIKSDLSFKEKVELFKAKLIMEAYRELGSSYKVAEKLGISQRTAARMIKKYSDKGFQDKTGQTF